MLLKLLHWPFDWNTTSTTSSSSSLWKLPARGVWDYSNYLLLVRFKIIILGSNDLGDDAGDGGAADCGQGKRVLGGRYGQ